jgi:TonB family protein
MAMRRTGFMRLAWALSIILVSICGSRADDEALPTVHTLPCAATCANSTGPVPDFHPRPTFPEDNLNWYGDYVEGYVLLHYTITAEGKVSDIAVLELVGPKNFVTSAEDTVKDWTYKPATLNGKPVATCRTLQVSFQVRGTASEARDEIARAYSRAVRDIKDSKLDDAKITLDEAQSTPKLNFYERGMLANLAASIALTQKDYLEARRLSQLATDHGIGELPLTAAQSLLETRVKASLALGDLVDALETLDRLKRMKGFDPASPIVKLVEDSHTKADSMPMFGMTGRIPASGEAGQNVYFGLYHRNFAFQNVSGTLEKFTLSCKQQAIESEITEKAEWHVPKSWSDCHVLVRGTPGTTFNVMQMAG